MGIKNNKCNDNYYNNCIEKKNELLLNWEIISKFIELVDSRN